ncbi:sphingomyelin phosphodiesterase 1-like [Diabrotica undecimpunctata]|uniref:sphingomyelin phosphodiesterase 1-like n=1 Tax=Diabrotica undecimpunctata TaxID=50387 RepID=UPI003B639AA0
MKFWLILVCYTWIFAECYTTKNRTALFEQIKKGIEEIKSLNKASAIFETAIKEYNIPNIFSSSPDNFDKEEVCSACMSIADLLIQKRREGLKDADFHKQLVYFCNLISGQKERICEGLIKLNAPILHYVIDNTPELTGQDICGISLQDYGCNGSKRLEWTIDIPPKTNVKQHETPSTENTTSFNILHISDIHYDPRYTTNKTTKCGEPICCQDDQADGTTEKDTCGYWGSYTNSDIPWRTAVNALEQTKLHKYDYVYFTGDIVAHRVWNTSIEENTRVISQILDTFADIYNVPVFLVFGNHEAHPSNLYSEVQDPLYSSRWMYDILFQKMSKWVPLDEVKDTLLKGGFYTVSPRKGFRVIVLNNNICNLNNWWLYNNPQDPYDQLKWLVNILLEAEKSSEKVHILYHMVPGQNDYYKVWAREYKRIIERFSDTITAQFNGHSHKDEFYVYYNTTNQSQALSVLWNGASIVTKQKANPSYKIFSVNDATFELLDFEEWTYNLTLANLDENEPLWYKLYSFKETYGVKSLATDEINNLILRMAENPDLIKQYYKYKFRGSDISIEDECGKTCQRNLLCSMVTTQYADDGVCNKLLKVFHNSRKHKEISEN